MTYNDEPVAEADQLFTFLSITASITKRQLARENRRALAAGNAPRGADEAFIHASCCAEGEEGEEEEETEEEGDEELASFFTSSPRSAMQVIGSGGGAR